MLHVRVDVPPIPEMLEALAEGLVLLNVELMRYADERGIPIPAIQESGIVFRPEPAGREWWETASDLLQVVKDRSGDCEDLAAYYAAWCRYFGGDHATVRIFPTPNGHSLHAIVEHDDGVFEDIAREILFAESARTGVPARDLARQTTIDLRYT